MRYCDYLCGDVMKIELEINGKKVKLTVAAAKKIHSELDELFSLNKASPLFHSPIIPPPMCGKSYAPEQTLTMCGS